MLLVYSSLHPNTLEIISNTNTNKDIYPTKYYLTNVNNKNILKTQNTKNILVKSVSDNTKNELQKFMLLPSVIISADSILVINKIDTFDDLFIRIKILIIHKN
jgi:hypothetical protein